jgi:Secretion system C-terminal sorting domain
MKNLKINLFIKIILFLVLFFSTKTFSQSYVTWNPIANGNGVTGNYTGGNVTTTQGAIGQAIRFSSPSGQVNNLIANGAQTFSTIGALNNPPSRSLTFNFSTPVIVTRYNMSDIDLGGVWNDSFDFANINFANSTSTNCNSTVNGATPTIDVGGNAEFASWTCSNVVNSFTLNYRNTGGLTHAFLGYSLEVLVPPQIAPVCLNSVPPPLPTSIGNGIIGTWNPTAINTNASGIFTYTFTPNIGQVISCPIRIRVTTLPINSPGCCLITKTLISPLNDVTTTSNQQVLQTIFATNVINAGARAIYHGDFFVEMNPGFEAKIGSEFAAYIAGCDNSVTYKVTNEKAELKNEDYLSNKNSFGLQIYPNPSDKFLKVEVPNGDIKNISISSMDGRTIFYKELNVQIYEIDISDYAKGIYIVNVTSNNGFSFSGKLIKNNFQ